MSEYLIGRSPSSQPWSCDPILALWWNLSKSRWAVRRCPVGRVSPYCRWKAGHISPPRSEVLLLFPNIHSNGSPKVLKEKLCFLWISYQWRVYQEQIRIDEFFWIWLGSLPKSLCLLDLLMAFLSLIIVIEPDKSAAWRSNWLIAWDCWWLSFWILQHCQDWFSSFLGKFWVTILW